MGESNDARSYEKHPWTSYTFSKVAGYREKYSHIRVLVKMNTWDKKYTNFSNIAEFVVLFF